MEQNKNKSRQDTGRGSIRSESASGRGFASMDKNQQREIASEGGKAAHQKGVAHEWTSEEAAEAGRKGGQASTKASTRSGSSPSVRESSKARKGSDSSRNGGGK